MNYIRTKNNIYEVYAKERRPDGCVITTNGARIPYADILRESDDLIPLCDQFVVVGYYKKRPVIFDTLIEAERFVYVRECQDKDYVKIKGAIWIDNGIIYVTEMNKKIGRLELL